MSKLFTEVNWVSPTKEALTTTTALFQNLARNHCFLIYSVEKGYATRVFNFLFFIFGEKIDGWLGLFDGWWSNGWERAIRMWLGLMTWHIVNIFPFLFFWNLLFFIIHYLRWVFLFFFNHRHHLDMDNGPLALKKYEE